MTQQQSDALREDTARLEQNLLAIREKWNISRHPFYRDFANGLIDTKTLGLLLAQQYHHIVSVLPSLALVYYKAPAYHRELILRQLVAESGIDAGDNTQSASSVEYILTFCESVGLSREQVKATAPLPAWRARALFNINVAAEETFSSYMAIKSVTEGQQWALNHELIVPALKDRGYLEGDPVLAFFTRHFISNADFGRTQISIAAASLVGEDAIARATALAEETGRLYWCSLNDLYRVAVRGHVDPMPDDNTFG